MILHSYLFLYSLSPFKHYLPTGAHSAGVFCAQRHPHEAHKPLEEQWVVVVSSVHVRDLETDFHHLRGGHVRVWHQRRKVRGGWGARCGIGGFRGAEAVPGDRRHVRPRHLVHADGCAGVSGAAVSPRVCARGRMTHAASCHHHFGQG